MQPSLSSLTTCSTKLAPKMMTEKGSGLLSSDHILIGNIICEVLWVLRRWQKAKADAATSTKSVNIFLSTSKQEHSIFTCTLKEYASYSITQHVTIKTFVDGPVEHLWELLNKMQGRSECIVRIGSQQYSLTLKYETVTVKSVQKVMSSINQEDDSYFEFYLKIPVSKSFEMKHEEMELRIAQKLIRYKVTNPEVIIKLQSIFSDREKLRTFPCDASDHTIKIGGLSISVEPRNYISEAHVGSSRVSNVYIGQPFRLSSNSDPASCCQIGCVTLDIDLPGERTHLDMNTNKIKIFIHGPDGMPLFEGREVSFTRDFQQILEMDCSFLKIEDTPLSADNAEGYIQPDLMFNVISKKWHILKGCRKQDGLSSYVLILHVVLFLEDQELDSVHQSITGLRQKFLQSFQDHESSLKKHIKQCILGVLDQRFEKDPKQRQKEEALDRAVPTVVEAITTIVSNSTNETFRKNCLAYAGATDTMELASFLTDNLTNITARTCYSKDESLDIEYSGPSKLMAAITNTEDSTISDHQDGTTEELEELDEIDLLQAFSQGTDNESLSAELIQDTYDDTLAGAESDQWSGLNQTTDEIVKSLLEEDTFDEDLLSGDWLITEE